MYWLDKSSNWWANWRDGTHYMETYLQEEVIDADKIIGA